MKRDFVDKFLDAGILVCVAGIAFGLGIKYNKRRGAK